MSRHCTLVPVHLRCIMRTTYNYLFDNLESGKKYIVLEKNLEKVLDFGSKNLYEPW